MDVKRKAWAHIEHGENERGLALLRAWIDASPDDPRAWFEYGGALDFLDCKHEALEAYDRVVAIGIDALPLEDRPRLHAQLGSTLRNLGDLERSRALLEAGLERYPRANAIRVFLALTELAADRPHAAVDLLFDALLTADEDDSLAVYRGALLRYADAVRKREVRA
ncbi:MAG: tetratricopeptide repeat protein [Vulcanimicrobiaceae bacterium]